METFQTVNGISSVNVVDPEAGEVREGRDILIQGGRIENETSSGARGPALNGDGLFAAPGLIDTHVHALGVFLEGSPGPLDFLWVFHQQRKNLESFARAGVTTVRDLGAPLDMIRGFARNAARFSILSPRILFSGPVLTVPGGYPYFVKKLPLPLEALLGPLRVDVTSPQQARRVVDRLARAGAHTVKLCFQSVQYDDERTPIPVMPEHIMRAIVERARERNMPAAVHCVYIDDLRRILHIPFDSLEHVPMDAAMEPDDVERLAQKNIPACATLMTYGMIDHVDRIEELLREDKYRFEARPRRNLKQACRALRGEIDVELYVGRDCIETGSTFARQNVALLHKAGVPVCCGTDSGGAITPTGCPHWEMLDMKRAGLSDTDALRTATCVAADALRRPDLGRIQPNATADIVLLRGNPLEDISAIRDVAAVVRDGRLIVDNLSA